MKLDIKSKKPKKMIDIYAYFFYSRLATAEDDAEYNNFFLSAYI